jgi:uncharacterized membrane protein HdeD (DUF308 family)
MPEEKRSEPSYPFSSEPEEIKKPGETKPDNVTSSRWSTVSGLIPGLILIVLSVLFMLSNYQLLKADWWQYFLVILLVVFLIEYWVEYISPLRGKSRIKMAVIGLVLIAVGILFLFNPNAWWPLVLLAAGIILLIRFMIIRRRNSKSGQSEVKNYSGNKLDNDINRDQPQI